MPKIIEFPDVPGKRFEIGDDTTESEIAAIYDEERPSTGLFRKAIGDTAVSLAKGIVSFPQSLAGLVDIGTSLAGVGSFSEAIKPVVDFETTQTELGKLYSPDAKRAQRRLDSVKGVYSTLATVLKNPSIIQQQIGESLPSMLGGAAAAKKLIGAGVGRAVAAGAGEGLITAGQQAIGIEEATGDELSRKQAGLALVSGVFTGALGSFGNKVADKLGLVDINLLTSSGTSEAVKRGIVARAIGGAITEGALEELPQSVQEQIAQNIATDKPWNEGLAQAGVIGTVVGGLMGGAAQALPRGQEPSATVPSVEPTPPIQPDQPMFDEGRPILPATEVDRISKGIEEALSEIPAEEVLTNAPEVAPVTPEVATQEPEIDPITPEVAAPIQEVAPETSAFVPPEPNLLPLTTQVLQEQLTAVPEPVVTEPAVEQTTQGEPNALPIEGANQSVLQQTRQELGLPQVVQGNTQQEVATQESKKEEVSPVPVELPLRASDKSVRDHTITGIRKGDVITFSTKGGPKFTFNASEIAEMTEWDRKQLIERNTRHWDEEPGGAGQADRLRDSVRSVMRKLVVPKPSLQDRIDANRKASTPTLIQRLESKIKSPSDTTQAVIIPGLDPATARAVWNTALRIAIGVLKATKNVQRAIQAGIDSIRKALADRKLALDAATEAALRSEFESGLTATGPVRERAKTGTSQSALYQGGEYVLRNEKEDTKLANQFVDQRNGDLEQAFRDSKQIGEIAFRKVVQAEILARASVQWSKAGKFDPGLVRLMGSIGAEIKAMKSGAGQDLQAEKQVNQKLYQHMPVLSWLDILRQRQSKDIAPDLKGKEPAIIGAADKAGKVAKEAKEGKGKAFIEVLDEDMRQQGVPPEVRKKVLKAAARIIRTKPKTPEELIDAMAQEWNLESMDGPTSQRLKELSQEAQATPAGSRRNKVLQKMVDTLYDAKGVSASEFVRDFFYANVLSSLRTFADVLLGSSINGFTMAVRGALDTAIAGKNYTKAIQIIGQYFGGIAEGASNAIDIIKTGDYSRLPDSEARLMAMLDDPLTMRAGALEAFKRAPQTWKKVLGQTAYVSRIMTGLDFVGGLGARDSMLVYSVMTRKDIDSLEALEKRFQKETNHQAEQQAIAELGPKAKHIDVLARKRELLEEGISKDIRDNASELGRLAALNAQPVGWLQPLVDAVARMPFLPKTLAGLNFLRSSVNMVQQAADFLPGVGLVSFGRARMTESEWFKTLPKNHPMRLFGLSVSPERRRLIAHAQIGGFAITALMAAKVLYDDDEDKTLDISAGWKGVTPNQRKQLMDSGERPYHIKIGNRWFSYKQTPFAAALAFVGTARDQKRFNKEKWDEQQFGEKLINAFIGGSLYLKDISALSSFANLVGISASNTEDIDYQDVNRTIAQSIMNAGGGMVPLASLQRDIDSWLDPKIYKANSGVDYWLRNIPFVRRTIGEGPVINALGEPAIVGREPWSRWTVAENERPLYDMLRKKFHEGVFLPVAGATAQIIDKQTGQRRRMTPLETYEYQKKSGQLMKQQLEKNLKALDRMTAPEFQKWVEQTQRQISVEARR